jgi:type IV secretory pathway VirB10-like protein
MRRTGENEAREKVRAMKHIACRGFGLLITAGLFTLVGAAQSQPQQNQTQSGSAATTAGPSLGDYARQIRKSTVPEKPKVFDNDNLPTGDKLSVIGAAPPAEAPVDPKAQSDANAETKPAEAPKASAPVPEENQAAKEAMWKQWGDKVKGQQDQIDLMTRELDVLQREYQIRAAAMYGDAGNRLRNQTDWDKQDAQYKQQIADKQKALDDAKQKLDDMQEEARKAGVPSSYLGS